MNIKYNIKNIKSHKTCTCKCRLDARIYNNKICWNNDINQMWMQRIDW